MLQGVAADMMARAVAHHQEFGGRDAASPFFGEQDLRVDGGEGHGQFLANGVLAFGGKRIGDAGDGRGDVHGVKGGEDEVAGFGGGYSDAHGFGIPHFTDHDDVRGLAQRRAKSGGKVRRVVADFDLFDDAAHMLVFVLDGVFDDDDMARFAVVNVVDERGHGGGFAGARGTAEENQAARKAGEIFDGG